MPGGTPSPASDSLLESFTSATIVDPDKFQEHLRSVTSGGFATDLEESEAGVCCAAAPVFDSSGRVVAALSVTGPAFRLGHDPLQRDILPRVIDAAGDLSTRLGHAAEALSI